MKPADAAPPRENDAVTVAALLRWMFGFLRPVAGLAILACIYLTLWVSAEVLIVRQTAEAVNEIKRRFVDDRPATPGERAAPGFGAWISGDDPSIAGLRRELLLLAGLSVGLAILAYLREVAGAKLSMNKVFYMRQAIYDQLQRIGQSYHDAVSTGELINRSFNDLQNIRAFVQSAVLLSLEIVLVVSGYIILLATRSPWVAALALAPLPVWTWYIVRFSKRVQPVQRQVMEAGDRNVSLLTENIAGVHVVRAFATEAHEIGKYGQNCDSFMERVLYRIRLYANFMPVIRSIAMASHLTLFLAAGVLVVRGQMLAGDVLMLGAAMGAILSRLQQVSVINEQYQSAIVSARRLHEMLFARPTVAQPSTARALPPGNGAVRFENVTFGYDPAKPVLHDLSFDVKGGSIVAIVGPTGAGKTTLVQLIARLYEPQCGRVLIDGADIRDVSLDDLRTQVAYVFQETYLFSDSIAGNIAYGRPRHTETAGAATAGSIEAAARLAQAHEFIEVLPRGYDSPLGERGASLSGGQRQRLAIARAILPNPRILILDDATAAVDPETEDLIHRGLRGVLHDRTVFVITHRVSTVRRADLVLVIENGRITQSGTHDELMRRDGHYRDIAAVQLYGDRLERDAAGDLRSHTARVLHDHGEIHAAETAGKLAEEAATEGEP